MIRRAQTTSVLNELESYRKNKSDSTFRLLLSSLSQKLRDNIYEVSSNGEVARSQRPIRFRAIDVQQPVEQTHIDQCILTVLCYLVSVINKYQIHSVENLWENLLSNNVAKTIQVNRS